MKPQLVIHKTTHTPSQPGRHRSPYPKTSTGILLVNPEHKGRKTNRIIHRFRGSQHHKQVGVMRNCLFFSSSPAWNDNIYKHFVALNLFLYTLQSNNPLHWKRQVNCHICVPAGELWTQMWRHKLWHRQRPCESRPALPSCPDPTLFGITPAKVHSAVNDCQSAWDIDKLCTLLHGRIVGCLTPHVCASSSPRAAEERGGVFLFHMLSVSGADAVDSPGGGAARWGPVTCFSDYTGVCSLNATGALPAG